MCGVISTVATERSYIKCSPTCTYATNKLSRWNLQYQDLNYQENHQTGIRCGSLDKPLRLPAIVLNRLVMDENIPVFYVDRDNQKCIKFKLKTEEIMSKYTNGLAKTTAKRTYVQLFQRKLDHRERWSLRRSRKNTKFMKR